MSNVHPANEVINAAIDLAERISSHSLVALKAIKKAIDAGNEFWITLFIIIFIFGSFQITEFLVSSAFQMPLHEGLQLERELFFKALSSVSLCLLTFDIFVGKCSIFMYDFRVMVKKESVPIWKRGHQNLTTDNVYIK